MVCGKRWSTNTAAFKCKTCETDSSCIVCVECFQNGDHEGHDTYLIRTSGGVCDCGDATAWDPAGFCSLHKGQSKDQDPSALLPPPIAAAAKATFPPVFAALITHAQNGNSQAAAAILHWLLECLDLFGDPIRRIMWEAPSHAPAVPTLGITSRLEGDNVAPPCLLDSLFSLEISGIDHYASRLRKPIFDLVYEWIQDIGFKYVLASLLIPWYPALSQSQSSSRSECIISLSIQILTIPDVALHVAKHANAFAVVFDHFRASLAATSPALAPGAPPVPSFPRANPEAPFFADMGYIYAGLYDIDYMLNDPSVGAFLLFDSPTAKEDLTIWATALGMLEELLPETRKTDVHVEHVSNAWVGVFNVCAILESISQKLLPAFATGSAPAMASVLSTLLSLLPRVFLTLPPPDSFDIAKDPVSTFHPLVRLFSSFLSVATNSVGPQQLAQLLDIEAHAHLWDLLAEIPIRMFVLDSQVRAGMWTRNGWPIRAQIKLYDDRAKSLAQMHDLALLQSIILLRGPESIIPTLLSRFGLPLSNDALELLVNLSLDTSGFRLVSSPESVLSDQIRHELAVEPLTHSKLVKVLSAHVKRLIEARVEHSKTDPVDAVIESVASFHRPSATKSGVYKIRSSSWARLSPYYLGITPKARAGLAESYNIRASRPSKKRENTLPPTPWPHLGSLAPPPKKNNQDDDHNEEEDETTDTFAPLLAQQVATFSPLLAQVQESGCSPDAPFSVVLATLHLFRIAATLIVATPPDAELESGVIDAMVALLGSIDDAIAAHGDAKALTALATDIKAKLYQVDAITSALDLEPEALAAAKSGASSSASTPLSPAEKAAAKRKEKARRRQAKMMAKFAKKQSKFASNDVLASPTASGSPQSVSGSPGLGDDDEEDGTLRALKSIDPDLDTGDFVCAHCLEHMDASQPLSMLSLVQTSLVYSKSFNQTLAAYTPTVGNGAGGDFEWPALASALSSDAIRLGNRVMAMFPTRLGLPEHNDGDSDGEGQAQGTDDEGEDDVVETGGAGAGGAGGLFPDRMIAAFLGAQIAAAMEGEGDANAAQVQNLFMLSQVFQAGGDGADQIRQAVSEALTQIQAMQGMEALEGLGLGGDDDDDYSDFDEDVGGEESDEEIPGMLTEDALMALLDEDDDGGPGGVWGDDDDGARLQEQTSSNTSPESGGPSSSPSGATSSGGASSGSSKKKKKMTAETFPLGSPHVRGKTVTITGCGHCMHASCYETFKASLRTGNALRSFTTKSSAGEFLCPLCKSLSNALVPVAFLARPPPPVSTTSSGQEEGVLEIDPSLAKALRKVAAKVGTLASLSESRDPHDMYDALVGTVEVLELALRSSDGYNPRSPPNSWVSSFECNHLKSVGCVADVLSEGGLMAVRDPHAVLAALDPSTGGEITQTLLSETRQHSVWNVVANALGSARPGSDVYASIRNLGWDLVVASGHVLSQRLGLSCVDPVFIAPFLRSLALLEMARAPVGEWRVGDLGQDAGEVDVLVAGLGLAGVEEVVERSGWVAVLEADEEPRAEKVEEGEEGDVMTAFEEVGARVVVGTTGVAGLVAPPTAFEELALSEEACSWCGESGRSSRAYCLTCGVYMCKESCSGHSGRSGGGMGNLNAHMATCSGSTGLFILTRTSEVLALRVVPKSDQVLGAKLGSVYLDAHGEQDIGLRRGRPLVLSADLFAHLNDQHVRNEVAVAIARASLQQSRPRYVDWRAM